jgi:hypothetical protein
MRASAKRNSPQAVASSIVRRRPRRSYQLWIKGLRKAFTPYRLWTRRLCAVASLNAKKLDFLAIDVSVTGAVMKIAWFTPYSQLIDQRRLPAGTEFLIGLSVTVREQRADDVYTRTVGLAERVAKLEAPSDHNSVDRDSSKAQHEA